MANESKGHDMGKNMGQGLANVNDDQRRDLLNRGGDQRTEDQRDVRSSDMVQKNEQGQRKDDPGSAPESGSP